MNAKNKSLFTAFQWGFNRPVAIDPSRCYWSLKSFIFILIIGLGWLGKSSLEGIQWRAENSTRNLPLGKRLQQQAIRGLLGGLRPVVADIAWLGVTTAWDHRQWGRLQENIWIATRAQPESILFWDIGAWHLAWNAALGERSNILEKNLEERKAREAFWVNQGRILLEEASLYHPEHFKVWLQLGLLHQERRHDYAEAYRCFLQAAALPGAPAYVARLAGNVLEKSGNIQGAIAYWETLLKKNRSASERVLIEKRLLKLQKDSMIDPLKPLP